MDSKKLTPEERKESEKHIPLIHRIINREYRSRLETFQFVTRNDLEQAGYEGIARAIIAYRKRKPKNTEWSTVLGNYIKAEMRKEIDGTAERAGERQIRIPYRSNIAVNTMDQAHDELTQELKRFPYNDELAKYLGWTEEFLNQIQQWSKQLPHSYDELAMYEDQDENTPVDFAQSVFDQEEDDITDIIVNEALQETLDSPMLNEREREILLRRNIGDESFQEIGVDLNVSRQRVQQVDSRALRKIQDDSRLRRHHDDNLFIPNMRTAHIYRFANRDRSDNEWWAENVIVLEMTDECRQTWLRCGLPRQCLGIGI